MIESLEKLRHLFDVELRTSPEWCLDFRVPWQTLSLSLFLRPTDNALV